MNVPDSSTSSTRSRICGVRRSYCARTSTRGTGTSRNGRRAPPTPQEQHTGRDDEQDGSDVQIPEVAADTVVGAADGPAQACEREAADGAAGERSGDATRQCNPDDPSRNRDERTR